MRKRAPGMRENSKGKYFFGQQEQFSSDSVINPIKVFSSLVVTELTQKIIFFLCRV